MAALNAAEPDDRRMDFRIGINLGDVMAVEDDIYGDGVNVASRIEGLAPPGGIRYTAMAPNQYVICAAAPADVRDQAAWRRQTVVAEGDGRQRR